MAEVKAGEGIPESGEIADGGMPGRRDVMRKCFQDNEGNKEAEERGTGENYQNVHF